MNKKYSLIIVLIVLILVSCLSIIFYLLNNKESISLLAFQTKDFYRQPDQSWQTYTNTDFNISFRYPTTMRVNQAIPLESYDVKDSFQVHLTADKLKYSVDIYGSTDPAQCKNIAAYMHLPYSNINSKKINGKMFLINTRPLLFIPYGVNQVFGYIQKSPVCRIARVTYAIPLTDIEAEAGGQGMQDGLITAEQVKKTGEEMLSKTDFSEMLQTVESIIGSINTI